MTHRRILPQRRGCETFDLEFGGLSRCHTITLGYYNDGTIGEVFINGGKSGELVDSIAHDSAVLLSMALQHGVPLETIRSAIKRNEQGEASTIVGCVIDRLSEIYTAQPRHNTEEDHG